MAKKSRASIIAELEGRKIGYSEEMTDEQLAEILDKAIKDEKKAKDAEKKAEEKKLLESNIDYSGVKCGLTTVQNLHRRLTIIERKLGLDK